MRTATFYLKTLSILVSIHLFLSCSKDEEPAPQFEEGAHIIVDNIKATSVELSLTGGPPHGFSAQYLVRKKGETDFEAFEYRGRINVSVEPGFIYEVTMKVSGIDGYPLGMVEFVTPPFDYITTFNSEDGILKVNSEVNFKHELTVNISNVPSGLSLSLVNIDDLSKVIQLNDLTVNSGQISFTIPDETLSDDPYQYYQGFYLQYNVQEYKGYVNVEEIFGKDTPIIFYVQNPKPHIENIQIYEDVKCNLPSYRLSMVGYFLGGQFDNSLYKIDNYVAIITRIDNGSEIIIDESTECISFEKYFRYSYISHETSLKTIHELRSIYITHPKIDTEEVKFTTGDYKIKITFSNEEGDYYETNEFKFTLE